jgi:hypothetical protein
MQKNLALTLALLVLASCGKKKDDSPYTKDPTVPLVDLDTDPPTPLVPAPPHAPLPPDPHHPHPAPPPLPPQDHPTKYCNKAPSDPDYRDGVGASPGSRDGYDFGLGGGCMHRPIREVWAAALNQQLMQWVDVDDSRSLSYTPPAGVAFFFSVNYAVHRFITVDWDMDWYHTVKAGTKAEPVKLLINYKKVRGTSHISYWEGTIILDRVNDHVTSFAMLNQINADQTSPQDAADAVKDVYGKLRNGAPDWSRLK